MIDISKSVKFNLMELNKALNKGNIEELKNCYAYLCFSLLGNDTHTASDVIVDMLERFDFKLKESGVKLDANDVANFKSKFSMINNLLGADLDLETTIYFKGWVIVCIALGITAYRNIYWGLFVFVFYLLLTISIFIKIRYLKRVLFLRLIRTLQIKFSKRRFDRDAIIRQALEPFFSNKQKVFLGDANVHNCA